MFFGKDPFGSGDKRTKKPKPKLPRRHDDEVEEFFSHWQDYVIFGGSILTAAVLLAEKFLPFLQAVGL